ncbi:zinc-binding alcohol dehydrogenase family protein [Sphingobium sp. B2D3A]|uniref:zinc-binding alcohol dehydrogenase family protein n=1 Tax=unclassified Sphingobium TaxID=2611147 RepID=UPI00222580EC|nr:MULTISPECIES: zinc-binding alcohol dehydrogenase family protein [unclassified Sphingobium]MCW2335851.1 zinc-binding alcohol dehydrogenase family protein [Sphingobium sp. B2D3A]MCW2385610.1 zinc-binding alcohol dehydrogenase family protein [Sphingobium sp. B2D3D]
MKAFAYDAAHPLTDFALTLRDLPDPVPGPQDLLVRVVAFALNPVDTKIRQRRGGTANAPVVLGWDAAGIVEAVGAQVQGFAVGDAVYYAGDLNRPGSYARLQAVDHRLVAHKPASLDFADAAALPLTALTAYEAMLERGIVYDADSRVLIIGGAGGVGSMAIQLLKALTPATVIATASRPETVAFAQLMGADHVIGRDVQPELAALGLHDLHAIFSTTHTDAYLPVIPALLRPFGHLMVIDDPAALDILPFKQKALSVHWEFMFAKSINGFRMAEQQAVLRQVAALVDAGTLVSTRTRTLTASVDTLREAHAALEAGALIGKTVMRWD